MNSTLHSMVVLAKAVPGKADELANWYDSRHLPDLLRVPGMIRAVRHELRQLKVPSGAPVWDFLIVYEIEGADPMTVVAEAGRRMGSPDMPASSALESASTAAFVGTAAATLAQLAN